MTDTTTAAVKRYRLVRNDLGYRDAICVRPDGDYVTYGDYRAVLSSLETAAHECDIMEQTCAALSAQLEAANQSAEMLANSLATARTEGKADGLQLALDCASLALTGDADGRDIYSAILALIPASMSADHIPEDPTWEQIKGYHPLEPAQTVQEAEREDIVATISDIIGETHDLDVRDEHYADAIVRWLEQNHPAALRAIAGGHDE